MSRATSETGPIQAKSPWSPWPETNRHTSQASSRCLRGSNSKHLAGQLDQTLTALARQRTPPPMEPVGAKLGSACNQPIRELGFACTSC
jgi:hypothetical protein